MLDWATNAISSLGAGWFYFALFLSAYIENIFPPVPGDTVTVFAAYLVGRSQQHLTGVFVSTNLGSIAGFMTYYAVGRLIHPEYFVRKNYRFLPATSFKTAGEWFQRWGYWIVLGNRFLSGIRSVISLMCGMYRLPWVRVLVLSAVGCSVWNGLMILAGYLLGENWRSIEYLMAQYSRVVMCLLVLFAVIWWYRRRSSMPRA